MNRNEYTTTIKAGDVLLILQALTTHADALQELIKTAPAGVNTQRFDEDLNRCARLVSELQAAKYERATDRAEIVGVITDEENGRKWEFEKIGENDYRLWYSEYFEACGWRLICREVNYTREVIEDMYDIKLTA